MKIKLEEIKQMALDIMSEAKKKKEKAKELARHVDPLAYSYSEAFDFSAPLGQYNIYKTQGVVNWGPMTSTGTKVDDRAGANASSEAAIRKYLRSVMQEEITEGDSAWKKVYEEMNGKKEEKKKGNVWEQAMRLFNGEE